MADKYQLAAEYADRIERELRSIGRWSDQRPPDSAFQSQRAFFGDTMSFFQWLQFVLLERIRGIVEQRGAFPRSSQVAAYAVREWDGCDEAADLIATLGEFDDFISA